MLAKRNDEGLSKKDDNDKFFPGHFCKPGDEAQDIIWGCGKKNS